MTSYKEYNMDDYTKFLTCKFNANFGISEETIADWFIQQNGSRPVRVSYGVTKANLLSTYIPLLKKELGGYVIFLMYTVTEDGGAGNWINHFASDSGSTGVECMQADIDYLKNTSFPGTLPIARSAHEVLGGENYTPDVPGQDSEVYKKCEPASIGTGIVPGTLAGNAWIWAEKWCLANQGARAPYVYFGNPYDQIIDYIKLLGGDPFNGKGSGVPNPSSGSPKNDTGGKLPDIVDNALNKLLQDIKNALKVDVHNISKNYYYTNSFLKMERTYNNTYHLTIRGDFMKKLLDKFNPLGMGIPTENTPPDSSSIPPSVDSGKDSDIMKKINTWCLQNLGQSYDMDGMYGAQCVDMIVKINQQFSLHLDTSGDVAKHIYQNPLPSGWKKVPGDVNNDANSEKIWNSLPNGAIVWFTNAGAGHVAVKTGAWADCIQQNYNSGPQALYGGPMVRANLKGWITGGGAGFLGAWVTA